MARSATDSGWNRDASYFAAFVGLGLTAACLGPTLPSLAAIAGTSLARIGLLVVVRSLGSMLGSLLAGPLIDRGRGGGAVAGSLVLMVGTMALVPILGSIAVLLALFFVLGMGQGALNTGANTLIVWGSGGRTQSRLSLLHFSFGLGAFLAPMLVVWFLGVRSDGLFSYWVIAAVLVPVLLWVVGSSRRVTFEMGTGPRPHASSARAFGWAMILFFLFVGVETTIGSWLFAFAQRAADASAATAGYLVATYWVTFMATRLFSGLADLHVKPSVYVMGGAISAVALSLLILGFAGGGVGLWVGVAALGVAMAALFPQAYAFCSHTLGMTGRRTAWLLVASSLGGMAIPWLTGLFLETTPRVLPGIIAIAMMLALVAFRAVLRTAPKGSDASGA